MIYRGPIFLAVVFFSSTPSSPFPSASWRSGEGEGKGVHRGEDKSFDGEKDRSSIHHSILSGVPERVPTLRKSHFFGAPANLSRYSIEK
jgi:hypothetical protein